MAQPIIPRSICVSECTAKAWLSCNLPYLQQGAECERLGLVWIVYVVFFLSVFDISMISWSPACRRFHFIPELRSSSQHEKSATCHWLVDKDFLSFCQSFFCEATFSPTAIATPGLGCGPSSRSFCVCSSQFWSPTLSDPDILVSQPHLISLCRLAGFCFIFQFYLHRLPEHGWKQQRVLGIALLFMSPHQGCSGFPWLVSSWYLSGRQFLTCLFHALLMQHSATF